MVTLFVLIACLVLSILAIGGIAILLIVAKQGEGVSDARREWIEGPD